MDTGRGLTDSVLLVRAETAVEASSGDPHLALMEARRILLSTGDPECTSVARRALALALRERGELGLGVQHLIEAISRADEHGLAVRAAQARLSLMALRADQGDIEEAMRLAAAAEPHLAGQDAFRLAAQRGMVLSRQGHFAIALEDLNTAVHGLGDQRFLAGALMNRAIARSLLGDFAGAEEDLRRCHAMAMAAGYRHLAALSLVNSAFVASQRGDLPETYARYQVAEAALAGYPERIAALQIDLADALLGMRLPSEARGMLVSATRTLTDAGAWASLAEANMLLAQAELLAGLPERACTAAAAAWGSLIRQNRYGWALLAQQAEVRARFALGRIDEELFANARACSAELAAAGWPVAADHMRIITARTGSRLGDSEIARCELQSVLDGRSPGLPGIAARWQARALLRILRGDRPGAFAAVAAGLRAVAGHVATGGGGELRAHAARWGEELADIAIGLALDSRSAASVLGWEERRRTLAVDWQGPSPQPADRELSELRHVNNLIYQEINDGETDSLARLRQRRDALEEGVRRRVRASGRGKNPRFAGADDPPSLPRLHEVLADTAFAEFVHHDGDLAVIVVAGGGCQIRTVLPLRQAREHTTLLRYGLRRLAMEDTSPQAMSAVRAGLAGAARALDDGLLGPIRSVIGDRELIIAPCAGLQVLPWMALPSLSSRPVSLVPSARWLVVNSRPGTVPAGRPVIAAGPGLRHAAAEARAVARHHRGAHILTGRGATAEAVRSRLDGALIAHLAAHGEFRADSPLMTGLRLVDGPLMAYDLLRIRAPKLTVLSACDAGLSEVPAEGASLGIAGTLLNGGGACVIAGVVPVRDDTTAELMATFHRLLAGGATAAQALAGTKGTGFVCFGAGFLRLGESVRPVDRPSARGAGDR